MTQHIEFGRKGEELAAAWLAGCGYQIIDRNWRRGRHEIDIIAQKDSVYHLIEVKSGRHSQFGYPETRVGHRKMARMLKAGSAWLYQNPYIRQVQFDVLSIVCPTWGEPQYMLFEDVYD